MLFLSGDVIYRSGYRIRVLSELKALARQPDQDKPPFQLYALFFLSPKHLRYLFSEDSSLTGLRQGGVSVYQVPGLPNMPWPGLYLNLLWMTLVGGLVVRWKEIGLIHAQNLYFAFVALILKKLWGVRYILDMHGLVPEESLYQNPLRRHASFRVLKWMEEKCVVNADCVLCVSQALSQYLQSQYNASASRIIVIPSGVDPSLFHYDVQTRRELRVHRGLNSRLIVLYAGNIGRWHAEARLVELFREIKARREDAYFLVLTPAPTKQLAHLLSSSSDMEIEEDYTVLSVAHHEVPFYSMMADVALLVRERNRVNEVACPTKFVEYLACGVPVLASSGVGDVDRIVRQHKIGATFDTDDSASRREAIENILALIEKDDRSKERCAWVARQYFSWEANIRPVATMYRRLGEGG